MSRLYEKLKKLEQEKVEEPQLREEESFPIEGEIKRQKAEQRNLFRRGFLIGGILFIVTTSAAGVYSFRKFFYPKTNNIKRNSLKTAVNSFKVKSDRTETYPKTPSSKHPSSGTNLAQAAPPKTPSSKHPSSKTNLAQQNQGSPSEGEELLVENYFSDGAKFFKVKQYKKAQVAYWSGLRLQPDEAVGYNNLGTVYYAQGKLKKSRRQLKLAIRLSPHYAEVHYNLAVVLEKLGLTSQALTHYLRFMELYQGENKKLIEKVRDHIEY